MYKRSNYGKILMIMMLGTMILIGATFAAGIFSQQDAAMNVTGTAYEGTYESHVAIQKSFVEIVPIVSFLFLIATIVLLVKVVRH
ncbi:MAG: hypothetical protein LLF94_08835 [Chlamydiales bacterium]|nr:hypothetical protein [Chlamydiales bacterium]